MRTGRRVIVLLLVSCASSVLPAQQTGTQSATAAPAPPPGAGQPAAAPAGVVQPGSAGSVDSSVTVTGRDDSVLPIPEPAVTDDELALPPLDTTPMDAPPVGPFAPPVAATSPPPPPDLGSLNGPRSQ